MTDTSSGAGHATRGLEPRTAGARHGTNGEASPAALRALRQDAMACDLAEGLDDDETAWLGADAG